MLYQKLLVGSNPFYISAGKASAFEIHRHPELELSYCLKGEYSIVCENRRHTLKEGDFAIVAPMAAHEIPANTEPGEMLTIEVGYALLGEFFNAFAQPDAGCRLYKKDGSAAYAALAALLEETVSTQQSNAPYKVLSIKGNLYKISALLLRMTANAEADHVQNKKMVDIANIDQALKKIYNNYCEPLNIEEISASCGYSKSNFCKLFKAITGETFHNTLNRHRIEIACMLLIETNDSIEKIAQETGFADSKSFCRVFKSFQNESAGAYRRRLSRG